MTTPSAETSTLTQVPAMPTARHDLSRWLAPGFGVLGLIVFGVLYWHPGYRYDEYLVAAARTGLPWDELLKIIANTDPAPGPLYILMKPWTAVSSDPAWTRIPSLLAMAIAVAALVALVQRSINTRTAIFAGLLMLALPANTRWGQDNRMYALATMCTVLAVWLWYRSAGSDRRWWSISYGAAVFGMGLFHLYTLTLIPVLLVAVFWLPGPRRTLVLRTLAPAAIAIVLLGPQIYLNLAHPTGSPTNPPLALNSIKDIAYDSFGGPWLTLLVVALALGGSIWAWRAETYRVIVVVGLGWALFPLAVFMLARGLAGVPTLAPRYYVFAIPATVMLAALGLAALWDLWRPSAVLVVLVILALAIPGQLAVRRASAHSLSMYQLDRLLRQPGLSGLPIVAASPETALKIDAATYPRHVLIANSAPPQPVAVVIGGVPLRPNPTTPYLQADSAWRTVVRCTGGAPDVLEVVANPQGQIPTGSPDSLAKALNKAVPRSRCVAVA